MLTSLHIENVALIVKTDIYLKDGFTVLTGETGSGKSLIIDSINFLLGDKVDKDMIRSGESTAKVFATFEKLSDNVISILDKYGLELDSDGCLIIGRTISHEGRSTIRINGVPVTLSVLRELGKSLINFHGQHDNNNLIDDGYHIKYLDSYADNQSLIDEYNGIYHQVQKLKKELESLELNANEKQYKIDMLSYYINEIDSANLVEDYEDGEDEEVCLLRQRNILANRDRLLNSVNSALDCFENENDKNIFSLLSDVIDNIEHASRVNESFENNLKQLDEASSILNDVQASLSDFKYKLEDDDYSLSLDDVENRLELIKNLKKKYGSSIKEILEYSEKAKVELDNIVLSDERIVQIKVEIDAANTQLEKAAKKLSENRKLFAEMLVGLINSELVSLDMNSVTMSYNLEQTDYSLNGADRFYFIISTNKGEQFKPLSKIASGGELSRLMLAMKSVMSRSDFVDTLIFDEIDTGVSGIAAGKIADKLKAMSVDKQVITVTHLAQIAAAANNHLFIRKFEQDDRTVTEVSVLDYDSKVEEIARMIGGEHISESVISTAKEMINKYIN